MNISLYFCVKQNHTTEDNPHNLADKKRKQGVSLAIAEIGSFVEVAWKIWF